MSEIYLIALIVGIVAVVILIFWLGINIENPVERAGRRGEEGTSSSLVTPIVIYKC